MNTTAREGSSTVAVTIVPSSANPNPSGPIDELLVPVGAGETIDRLVGFVAALIGDRSTTVTLQAVVADESEREAGEENVSKAARALRDAGVTDEAIRTTVEVGESRLDVVTAAADDHDAVVMAEGVGSIWSMLFGDEEHRVAARSLGPVVVVRRPPEP